MAGRATRNARDTAEAPTLTRILEAALELFAEQGFHASGIREIGARAGVNTSVLYHYARSKDDLLYQLMAIAMDCYGAAVVRGLATGILPEEKLVALVATQTIIHGRYRQTGKLMENELAALPEGLREPVVDSRDQVERMWDETVRAGVEAGVFSVDLPRMARLALLRMAAGVSLWYSPDGPLSIEEVALAFSDLALGLVRAHRNGKLLRVTDLERPDVAQLVLIVEEEFAEVPEASG